MVNANDLEDWSVRVAEALIRELLDEHTRIMNGQPL